MQEQSKTQIVTNQHVRKLKKLKCEKTQNLKLWQSLTAQILTKLKTKKFQDIQKLELCKEFKTLFLIKLKTNIFINENKKSSPEKPNFRVLIRTT